MKSSAPAGCLPAGDVPSEALCFAGLQNFDLRRLFSRLSLRIDPEESFGLRRRATARQAAVAVFTHWPSTAAVWRFAAPDAPALWPSSKLRPAHRWAQGRYCEALRSRTSGHRARFAGQRPLQPCRRLRVQTPRVKQASRRSTRRNERPLGLVRQCAGYAERVRGVPVSKDRAGASRTG